MKPELRHYYSKTATESSKTTSISQEKMEGESAHYGETLPETPMVIRGTYPRYRATLVSGKPKMADVFQTMGMKSLSASEDEYLSDMPTQTPQRKQQTAPPRQSEPPLSTKVGLSSMVNDLKAFLTAELAGLKMELSTLTGRMRATEEVIQDLRAQHDATAKQTQELVTTCSQLNARVGQLKDMVRQRNIKLKGIPDTVTADELLHLIKRLPYHLNRPKD
ncbi:Hypothetical predicted protein [Pelobates cultripes]|uniref:Uncharacterized protein n=1 Tax=Pelobates cultripes TaxID=61616 RepID=A0AAD1WYW2_PELCU|nr:Hypothetical predicted protein [Pelobates cultripes]